MLTRSRRTLTIVDPRTHTREFAYLAPPGRGPAPSDQPALRTNYPISGELRHRPSTTREESDSCALWSSIPPRILSGGRPQSLNGGLSAEPRPRLGHWRRLPCESNGHDAKNLANAMPPRDSASTRDAFQVTSESTNRRVLAAAPSRPVGMWTARTKRAPETSRSWPPSSCAA